jgi:hypothetical protein
LFIGYGADLARARHPPIVGGVGSSEKTARQTLRTQRMWPGWRKTDQWSIFNRT